MFFEKQFYCVQHGLCSLFAQDRKKRFSESVEPNHVMTIGPLTVFDDVPVVESNLKIKEKIPKNEDSQSKCLASKFTSLILCIEFITYLKFRCTATQSISF